MPETVKLPVIVTLFAVNNPVNVGLANGANVELTYVLDAAYAIAFEYAVAAFVVASELAVDMAFEYAVAAFVVASDAALATALAYAVPTTVAFA